MSSTINEVLAAGNLYATSIPIFEPLSAPASFAEVLTRFGDDYNTSNSSHLYRFLLALCGEAGAGSVKKSLLYPKLQQQLGTTHFTDLDILYGNLLGLPRLTSEIYDYDPFSSTLTSDQWQEVKAKDGSYRTRCLLWMRAIIEGATPTGIELAVEAAIGVGADVIEMYKLIESNFIGWEGDTSVGIIDLATDVGMQNHPNAFAIIPREPDITDDEKRSITRIVDRLRPVNTIPFIIDGDYLRNSYPITDIDASSTRFTIQRFVTGRSDVNWPPVDPTQGFWIVANQEVEAPTYAFMDRQESVTYLTIAGASATTWHTGNFNAIQQGLFAHLNQTFNPTQQFLPNNSYSSVTVPASMSTPWMSRTDPLTDSIVVNNYYPLEYFALPEIGALQSQPLDDFWASAESLAPAQDTLTLDLGVVRPLNFIDFEICQKPINFEVQWSADGVTWTDIVQNDPPESLGIAYLPSMQNPWTYFQLPFQQVQARFLQITFTRRPDIFPLPSSPPFPWSIEVRGLRMMNLITNADEFIPDQGQDILNNSFRSEIYTYDVGNILENEDDDEVEYWESQPNPSPTAVESLYFDLRTGWNKVTMGYLDEHYMSDIDLWDMETLDTTHYEDGVVIDEIFIDPVTFGPTMHIYYSEDDESNWDDKLWYPIPIEYKLQKGFTSLPSPTFVKYVKLEFTNLSASPYQFIEYPQMPPVTFNKFPSWVQNYFLNLFPIPAMPQSLQQTNLINIDPIQMIYNAAPDNLTYGYQDIRDQYYANNDTTLSTFLGDILSGTSTTNTLATTTSGLGSVRLRTPIMWQEDLLQQLDLSRALSRKVIEPRNGVVDTGFNAELTLPVSTPITVQSTSDLSTAWSEKQSPDMYFPILCRHGYQQVTAPFSNKVAYSVAIKTVGFYRRDYTVAYDEDRYIETLDDDLHVELNEFIQSGFKFQVPAPVPVIPIAPIQLTSNWAQTVKTQGATTFSVNQDVRLGGQVTNNFRVQPVEVFGVNTFSFLSQVAQVQAYGAINYAQTVKTVAQLTSSLAQAARISGILGSNLAQDARLTGFATTSLAQNSRVTGQIISSLAQTANIFGVFTNNYAQVANVIGVLASSFLAQPARITAQLTGSASQDVRVGITNQSATAMDVRTNGIGIQSYFQVARITGFNTTTTTMAARISGQVITSANQIVNTSGVLATSNSAEAVRITGQLTANRVQTVNITGFLPSSFLAQTARTAGIATTNSAQTTKTQGQSTTNNTATVNITGISGSLPPALNVVVFHGTNPDIGAVESSASAPAGSQLIVNGNFETDASGWAGNVGTETLAQSGAHSELGFNSLMVTTVGSANSGAKVTPALSILASNSYTYTFSVEGPVGQSVVPTVSWYNNGTLVGVTTEAATALTGAWQTFTYTVNSPVGTNQAVPSVLLAGTPSVSFFVDNVSFTGPAGVGTPAPTITSFSPTSGAVGTSVVITGTNLTGASVATVNHGTSVVPTAVSSTSATFVIPSGSTSGVVGVTTPGGTVFSAATFTVIAAAPTISSFTPTSGPTGTTITINGTALTGATVVTVNHGPSAIPTVINDSQVTAIVSSGSTTGVVGITTPGGTVFTSTSFTVTGGATGSFTVALPGSTGQSVTTISHPTGAGVNIHNSTDPMVIADTIVVGGADQSFLVQPLAPGRTFQRIQSQNAVADGQSVSGNNKHGFYVKAANTTVLDYTANASTQADGGLSVRYAGFLGQRCSLTNFQLPLCVFADDEVHGTVTWRQINVITVRDTPVYLDCDEAASMVYDVVCDTVAVTGAGSIFANVNSANFAGTLTIINCTLNGSPVTASMIQNVPSGSLHIS